jgi:uncharacterized protein (DUF736 family)
MNDYNNTDTGALFKNDKKGNEKAPDYTGDIYDADGKKRRIAAWLKKSKAGQTYMSLKVENLRAPQQAADYEKPEPVQDDGFDSIPF